MKSILPRLTLLLVLSVLLGLSGGCATTPEPYRGYHVSSEKVGSIAVQVIIDTEPKGAQIYTTQGEYLGTAPLTRGWGFEKLAMEFRSGNVMYNTFRYENVNDRNNAYWDDLGTLFDANTCHYIGPGFHAFGQVMTTFAMLDCAVAPGQPCRKLGCDPSVVEFNYSFIAHKEGYRRQVQTVRCGSLLDYANGRLRSPCRRTVFLEKAPGADIDLDLRLKIKEPK
jgi:hypothetical protein